MLLDVVCLSGTCVDLFVNKRERNTWFEALFYVSIVKLSNASLDNNGDNLMIKSEHIRIEGPTRPERHLYWKTGDITH